jgi:hypothetical protein
VKDILRNAQRRFYALDISRDDAIPSVHTDANLLHLETSQALENGAAGPIASTYDRTNNTINSGLTGRGVPLVTFAPVLKGRVMALPEVLDRLLKLCEVGLGAPVEVEFAVNIESALEIPQVLHVLQVRPMVVEEMRHQVTLADTDLDAALVRSDTALGHGRREEISDVVMVDPAILDRSNTARVASIIAEINAALRRDGRHSILIGPGRWGSRDPWLGIPVAWSQISAARAIVETDFRDLVIEPSFGSHFFHNLTCFGVAFLAVHALQGTGHIRWDWFRNSADTGSWLDGAVRHMRLEKPLQVLVDGASRRGVIRAG